MLRLSSPFNRFKKHSRIIKSGGTSINSVINTKPSGRSSFSFSSGYVTFLDTHLKRLGFISNHNTQADIPIDTVDPSLLWQPDSSDSDIDDCPDYVGNTLDVIPFLSHDAQINYLIRSNGDMVSLDVVLGKYLLICCVSLPLESGHAYFNSMVAAYSELSRHDFEMVLVATIKPGCSNGDALFNDLFSRLPCLAIPFSETHAHAHICDFIRFRHSSSWEDTSAILVDPNQTILHHGSTPYYFHHFGSDWSPFLKSTVEAIEAQDEILRVRLDPLYHNSVNRPLCYPEGVWTDPLIKKPLSLHEDILRCDPSFLLPRIDAADQFITVSELSNKFVGLYLCHSYLGLLGYLIDALRNCVTKEPELVMLVVCVPTDEPIDSMQKTIKRIFKKNNITGYFHPDNSKVWRRLWRVFGQSSFGDEMVILPPNCLYAELNAGVVIECLQADGYPFARSIILERRFTALRSLTPSSLFKGTTTEHTCLIRNGGESNVCQSVIKGKRLLLYLDWLDFSPDNGKLCRLLMKQYSKMKDMDWEVVFVPMDLEDKGERHHMYAKMPWPIMPLRDAVKTSVIRQFIFEGMILWNYVIAFEADGRMVSYTANEGLLEGKIDETLFKDNLFEEVYAKLFELNYDM